MSSRVRSSGVAAVAALTVAALMVAAHQAPPTAEAADSPVLPAGFSDDVAIAGLSTPTTVQFAPNGHIFVAEKSGIIKRFTGLGAGSSIVADLRPEVYNFWDKGLLGLAVDPDYPASPHIYALYAHLGPDAPSSWSRADGNDTCPASPNGPGAAPPGDGCVTTGRLSRLTLDGAGVMTKETVLVNDWCAQFPSHHIGTVTFGPDGYLYAGGGEGAFWGLFDPYRDHGQFGGTVMDPDGMPYTERNPCADPPGGAGGEMTMPTAEGGSLRAQDKQTPSDPTGLAGTIIRVDPATGAAAPNNPSIGSDDENDRRIIGYGLRNPFRFTFRPGTSELWIGDVGAGRWEEINRHVNPTGAVRNYGWPCYEGGNGTSDKMPSWRDSGSSVCNDLYAAGTSAVRASYFGYRHGQRVSELDTCARFGGAVISGLAFYEGGAYPDGYDGTLFFTDHSRRCIWAMRPGADGLPDPARVITFVDRAGQGAVDLQIGPGGDLFYVDLDGGAIRRITYHGGNLPPTIVASATPTGGAAPLTVQFDASDTSDPDVGDVVSFEWDLDGDGEFDDATGPTANHTYAEGIHSPAVRALDDHGHASTRVFTILSGNDPPAVSIDSPAANFTWAVGQTISFSGSATDTEDGDVPSSRLSWQIVLQHCNGQDCHQHVIETINGASSGTIQAPAHEHPSYLELRLTAEDNDGLKATATRALQPQTVDLTFSTTPAGLSLTAAGERQATPFTRRVIVGTRVALDAPSPQTSGGVEYTYASWSDGGARSHVITAPAANSTYIATYSSTLPPDAPNKCAKARTASPLGAWVYNTLSTKRDKDWYRFTLAQQSWSRIVLGGLTGNFRLDLYSRCGTLIQTSNLAGRQFEEIYRRLDAGTYFVRVRHSSGALNRSVPYGVRFTPHAPGVHILSSDGWTDSAGNLHVDGEVLNNTDDRQRLVKIRATYFDAADNVLGHTDEFATVNVMAGRTRAPFRVSRPRPAGYHHYRVAVEFAQQTSEAAVQNLVITSTTSGVGPGLWFRGQFTNQNPFRADWTYSATTLYDRWGEVMNTSHDWTAPNVIPPGGSGSYGVTFHEHHSGWNRVFVLLQATAR